MEKKKLASKALAMRTRLPRFIGLEMPSTPTPKYPRTALPARNRSSAPFLTQSPPSLLAKTGCVAAAIGGRLALIHRGVDTLAAA